MSTTTTVHTTHVHNQYQHGTCDWFQSEFRKHYYANRKMKRALKCTTLLLVATLAALAWRFVPLVDSITPLCTLAVDHGWLAPLRAPVHHPILTWSEWIGYSPMPVPPPPPQRCGTPRTEQPFEFYAIVIMLLLAVHPLSKARAGFKGEVAHLSKQFTHLVSESRRLRFMQAQVEYVPPVSLAEKWTWDLFHYFIILPLAITGVFASPYLQVKWLACFVDWNCACLLWLMWQYLLFSTVERDEDLPTWAALLACLVKGRGKDPYRRPRPKWD